MNWNEWLINYEMMIRLGFFIGVFLIVAVWEWLCPARSLKAHKPLRWLNNLSLVFLNTLVLRWVFPAGAIGISIFAQQQGWGLFNYYETPMIWSVILSIIIMDFVIYIQHVMVHAIPLLWRFHRVHHADIDYDVTTGSRFHTVEILFSMLVKFATILLLGPAIMAVIIFEVILNATAMFNHGNISLPTQLDKVLRLILVTPDMHRVHHSTEDNETNSNFGFSLPWWDRLFGTYLAQPREGQQGMTIGIHEYQDERQVNRLLGMLTLPFIGKVSGYAINRREWRKRQ